MNRVPQSAMALIAVYACGLLGTPAFAMDLTLGAALARTTAVHPELRAFDIRKRVLELESRQAAFRPALEAGVELENLGQDVETTLTLAGVLELGGKRDARRTLAALRVDELAIEREIKALDVLAEVTRRYLDLAEAQARLPLLDAAVEQQQALARAVRKRFVEGASPEALALAAEAELVRRQSERRTADREQEIAWRALALMWSEREPGETPRVMPPSAALPSLQPLERLLATLRESPDIRYFAQADRVQEARQRLASTARVSDLRWELGVRRFDLTKETALVAGVSLPLGQGARGAINGSIEQGHRELLGTSRESTLLTLETTLTRVHGELTAHLATLAALSAQVLPKVSDAATQAARAYAAGALTYHESLQIQDQAVQLEWERLALRFDIDRQLLELQRLTGNPILSTEVQP